MQGHTCWSASTLDRGRNWRGRVCCLPWGSCPGTSLEMCLLGGKTSTHVGQRREVRLGPRPSRKQHTEEAIPRVSLGWGMKWCDYLNPSSARELQAACLLSEHSAVWAQGSVVQQQEQRFWSQMNLGSWPSSLTSCVTCGKLFVLLVPELDLL